MQNTSTGHSSAGRKLAAAVFLGASTAAMMAGTAHADGVTGATVDPHSLDKGSVTLNDHDSITALIGLDVPGASTPLWTYCIQRSVVLNPAETYDEHDWASEQARIGIDKQHLEGIKWILNNSYPQVSDLAKLAKDSGATTLDGREAVEGTQAAIWHFEDTKTTLGAEKDANVVALYNWLTTQATGHMNDSDQPSVSLGIGPAITNATAGSRVAFVLTSSDTTDAFIKVALGGPNAATAKVVDAAGNPVDVTKQMYKSGDKVYVQLPPGAAGSVTLTASGTAPGLQAGRVFVSHDNKPSQNLILAQAEKIPVSATTSVNWIPVVTPPTPSTSHSTTPPVTLAHTGAGDTSLLAGGALTLVGAGGGMMVFARRPRKVGTHA